MILYLQITTKSKKSLGKTFFYSRRHEENNKVVLNYTSNNEIKLGQLYIGYFQVHFDTLWLAE